MSVVQAATPLAAVFQFFVRDLAGMLGGVVFAFMQVGQYHTQSCINVCALSRCTMCCPVRSGMTRANPLQLCAGF